MFEIYLPRVDALPDLPEMRSELESPRGTETILVVEDDQMVRDLTCATLRRYGYQVIAAANAGEALLVSEKHQSPISLMITDVVMPQMGGRELAERLLRLRSDMR